jgi:hypothetical protein
MDPWEELFADFRSYEKRKEQEIRWLKSRLGRIQKIVLEEDGVRTQLQILSVDETEEGLWIVTSR